MKCYIGDGEYYFGDRDRKLSTPLMMRIKKGQWRLPLDSFLLK